MYNYISSIRKTSSIEHCIKCFFTKEEIPNLILSKNNIIEIYDLSKDGLLFDREINIYGKIILLINFPSSNENNINKDNLLFLTDLLNYCTLSYDKSSNNIITLFNGTIKEDLGKRQDKLFYSLDTNNNFLLISAYKNIFRLICLNSKMRLVNHKNDLIIKYKYENILFLSNFNISKTFLDLEENSNILTFAVVKTDLKEIDNKSNENNENEINCKDHQISLETFQIKVEPNSFNLFYYEKKIELLNNKKNIALNITSSRKSNYNNHDNNQKTNNSNTHESILEQMNLLQKIDISDNPTVSLMITHPDGLVILFFSNYALYYKYDITRKELITKKDKKVNYSDRKFINFALIDKKNYKYFVSDEYGNLFLLAIIDPFNLKQSDEQFILQILGEINYSTCLTYLDNNYLFNGSNKSDSQLIKIENKNNSLINVVKNYESFAPIKDFAIINSMEEENGIEIMTISGLNKNCSIKKIKKGSSVLSRGELKIKNIKNVFKINNKNQIYSFIITTITNSFLIDYDFKKNAILLNSKINFKEKELVLFSENFNEYIIIVTNISIKIYNNNFDLITKKYIEENNHKYSPLIARFNKKLSKLFVYSNNKKLKYLKIDINGHIIEEDDILENILICSFDICKYFLIYSLWDSNYLNIYSFNSKENKLINIPNEPMDYIKISSIQIIKNELIHFIFISLSNGKLIYFQLKESISKYNSSYTFSENDINFKRKYNFNLEDFNIIKIKQKNNKSSLFINTQTPSFINFKKNTPNILYFNIKNCKNLIEIEENIFLFVFNDKISFGVLSNIQSQNINSKFFGKQLNTIKLISFGNSNNLNESNKNKHFILMIEENKINNIFKNSFVLTDLNLKEISRYDFEYENEQSNSFTEISLGHANSLDNKLFVIGTSLFENQSKESISGHLFLIQINQNNNYSMKKLNEIETKGGIFKVISYQNIIYACIGNILYIYKLHQLFDNSYEFQLIKRYSEFNLINDIKIWKENKEKDINMNSKEKNNKNDNDNSIINNSKIHYLIISDLVRSIGIYSYDLTENKISELCRNYSNAWTYSISQLNNNLLYITDIDGNIVTLKRNNNILKENDDIKLEPVAYYNYGQKINSMILTKIKNKDLYIISSDNLNTNDDEVQILFFSTLEGSLGQIIQINHEIFDFLKALKDLLIKNESNYGQFNYDEWKNYNNGIINKESKGFIEGDIFEKFINNDEAYKMGILKQLNYSWNKSYYEVIHILETLATNH